ncbi:hypothetical protein DL93DRAFT_1663001 [Clavulina sp. PMI_390]|nr:hypothetical protein DL93DRAFT_1663001 [Clavulina sp. PMI_390]
MVLALLPYDIFDEILALCNLQELKALTFVSRTIQSAADRHFWRSVHIDSTFQREGYMALFSRRASEAHKITIEEYCNEKEHEEISNSLLAVMHGIRQNSQITDLNLILYGHDDRCQFHELFRSMATSYFSFVLRNLAVELGPRFRIDGGTLASVVRAHPQITSLEVPVMEITMPFSFNAPQLPDLVSLSIYSPAALFFATRAPIARLSIASCTSRDMESLGLHAALDGVGNNLTSLKIVFDIRPYDETIMAALLYCINIRMPRLEIINLRFTSMCRLRISQVVQLETTFSEAVASGSLTGLRELHLTGFDIGGRHHDFVRRSFQIWPSTLTGVWAETITGSGRRSVVLISRSEAERLGYIAQAQTTIVE